MDTGVRKQIEAAVADKTTNMHGTLKAQTVANLSTAMNGEAFAYVKYLLYAEHARKTVGRSAGNRRLEVEGRVEKIAGKVQKKIAKVEKALEK